MSFFEFDFPLPSAEEIRFVRRTAKENPDEPDSREMWILNEFPGVFPDERLRHNPAQFHRSGGAHLS